MLKSKRLLSSAMAIAVSFSMLSASLTVNAQSSVGESPASNQSKDFTITSPYATVDWDSFGQYKADFHAHSTNSDGGNLLSDMVEDHYSKDFDILAMTDHNYLNVAWDKAQKGAMSTERMNEIIAGGDRNNKGMTMITHSDEQSMGDHVNTFFADYNNTGSYIGTSNGLGKMEFSVKTAQDNGGISHINHPGRYTGASGNYGDSGASISNNPQKYMPYVDIFNKYSSCVGMEIINKKDGDSASDRILWDNILKQTLSQENPRNVWGFSNDDTHSLSATGFSYNMVLMPENTAEATKTAMENGAFYASAKVSVRELGADFVAVGEPPRISNITTNNSSDSITITGSDYDTIEWIADGNIIATGKTIDLNEHSDRIGSYVRAQLKGKGGISFTQAFALKSSTNNSTVSIKGNEFGVLELGSEVKYIVSIKDLVNTNAMKAVVSYDKATLEFVSATSLLENTIFETAKDLNGVVTTIVGTSDIKNSQDEMDAIELTFKVKSTSPIGNTTVTLDSVSIAENSNGDATDKDTTIDIKTVITEIFSYEKSSDQNDNGSVTLADLSIALTNFQGTGKKSDINRDGVVNTADFIIISGYIA